MKKIIDILFTRKKEDNYQVAINKIEQLKTKLELQPKQIKYKEIFITEINF